MAQQINLLSSALLPVKKKLPARTLVQLLAIVLALGGALAAGWLWNLDQSSVSYRQTLDTQGGEIQSLQTALQRARAAMGPADPALQQKLQERRAAVLERERVLDAVQNGMFTPGEGHSDRLQLVARTAPAGVWVTGLKMDDNRFEVAGNTLETDALNRWMAQLAASPLLRQLRLNAVDVTGMAAAAAAPAQASASSPAARPAWSFRLVSVEPASPAAPPGTPGVKP